MEGEYGNLKKVEELKLKEEANMLHGGSRTASRAGLWTPSSTPRIFGNGIPTGKPGPPDGRAPGLVPRLSNT